MRFHSSFEKPDFIDFSFFIVECERLDRKEKNEKTRDFFSFYRKKVAADTILRKRNRKYVFFLGLWAFCVE